jgi:hypothetical protein
MFRIYFFETATLGKIAGFKHSDGVIYLRVKHGKFPPRKIPFLFELPIFDDFHDFSKYSSTDA